MVSCSSNFLESSSYLAELINVAESSSHLPGF
jgi:hypothetical protein